MHLYISQVIPLIAFICYIALLLIVYRQGARKRVNQAFMLYLLSAAIWSLGSFAWRLQASLFWNRILVAGATGTFITFFQFVRTFLGMRGQRHWLYLGYGLFFAILVANLLGYVTRDTYFVNGIACYEIGPVMPFMGIYGYVYSGLAMYYLIRQYLRTRDRSYRNKIQYPVVGLSVTMLASFTNFVPEIGKYPIDIAASIVNVLLIAYAILRYQLLDITVVIRKGLLYSIPTAIIGAGYFLIISLVMKLFHAFAGPQILLLSFLVAVITAVVAQPLRDRAQLWIDRLFFREKYDSSLMLQRLSRTVASVLDLDRLTGMILDEVTTTIHVERAAFFLRWEESGEFHLMARRGLDRDANLVLRKDHPIVEWLSGHENALTRHDVDVTPQFKALWGEEREDLERMGAELFIPLEAKGELVGILAVGPKLSEETYSQDDQLTLTTLAHQVAVAIKNARLYEEVQRELAERKRAEEALRESEEKYRLLVENANETILVAQDGMLKFFNPETLELSGYSQEELASKPFVELVHPDDREMVVERHLRRLKGKVLPAVYSFRIIDKSGNTKWVEINAVLISWEGRPATLNFLSDITEHKRAQQELNDSLEYISRIKQEWESTADSLPQLVCLLDNRGRTIRSNRTLERWNVARIGDVKGRGLHELLHPNCSDPACYLEVFWVGAWEGLARGRTAECEADDRVLKRYVHVQLRPIWAQMEREGEEGASFAVLSIDDITERKQAEEALAEERALLGQRVKERTAELSAANAELGRALRLKDEFLATMSHELRTPLNAVLGLSEALQEQVYGPLNEKQLSSLWRIEESGRHLLGLINDILDLSKIEAGKVELIISSVAVEPVCEASLRLIREDAHRKRLTVSSTLDSTVTTLQADGRRLKQMLVNLLNNAVKFTPEGGEIGLEVVGDAEGEVVHFTVWDTGVGITEEDKGRLFKPFVQLDSSLSREHEGTGLGLSLVSRLAEMHGGGISVESEGAPGKGSRFTVSLPWQELAECAGPSTPLDRSEPEVVVGPVPEGGRGSVLLVEDNEDNIAAISDYLRAKGYRVVIARNGVEGMERAREEQPDLILMDIRMVGIDGLEVTRRIRADAELAETPIVALTALAMPGDRERCLEAGADEYMSKPVSLKELVKVIEAQMGQKAEGG